MLFIAIVMGLASSITCNCQLNCQSVFHQHLQDVINFGQSMSGATIARLFMHGKLCSCRHLCFMTESQYEDTLRHLCTTGSQQDFVFKSILSVQTVKTTWMRTSNNLCSQISLNSSRQDRYSAALYRIF